MTHTISTDDDMSTCALGMILQDNRKHHVWLAMPMICGVAIPIGSAPHNATGWALLTFGELKTVASHLPFSSLQTHV